MKIVATSDLHGDLPDVPECDLLLIAGDVCPVREEHTISKQRKWLRGPFADWLHEVPAESVVWIAGNHDYVCEAPGFERVASELPATYLCDDYVIIDGLTIYGTPWVPNLPQWAFYADDPTLGRVHGQVPESTDILLMHGPPYGVLDRTVFGRVGAPFALSQIMYRILPQHVVFGHVHEDFGHEERGGVHFWNVARMDEFYEPVHEPVVIHS